MLGMQCEIFTDTRNRKILRDKKKGQCYLLNAEDEKKVRIYQTAFVSSISIAVIPVILFHMPWIWAVLLGAAVYAAFYLYFNRTVLVHLTKVRGNRVEKKISGTETNKKQSIARAVAFLVIGLALLYCLVTRTGIDSQQLYWIAAAGACISIIMAVSCLNRYLRG